MLLHQLLRERRVARLQRRHDAAMLLQRRLEPPLLEQRVVAVQLHHLAQVGHHLVAPAVAGDLQQPHVKALVGGEERIAVGDALFERLVQLGELGDLCISGIARDDRGGIALEQCEQVEHLGQIALGHLGDVGAAAQLHRHQALGREHLQRLAQRRAADAELGRQGLLVDPAAGRERMREDALAHPLGHPLVERTLGQPRRRGCRGGIGAGRCARCGHRLKGFRRGDDEMDQLNL